MNAAAKKTTYDSVIETVDDTGTTTELTVEWWIFDGLDETMRMAVVVEWEWVSAMDSGWSYHYSVGGDLPSEVGQALELYVERLALERGRPL